MSRNPMNVQELNFHEDIAERYINMVCKAAMPSAIGINQMVYEVNCDETLNQVKNFISGRKFGEIGRYRNIKDELSISSDGLVLRGNRIFQTN